MEIFQDAGKLGKPRIGTGGEGISRVIHRQQIPEPSRKYQGNPDQIPDGEIRAGQPGFQGFPEAHRQFLGGVGGDPLRGVRQIRIGNPQGHHFPEKLFRIQDAGMGDHRQTLLISHGQGQPYQGRILHFPGHPVIAQKTAEDGQRGVQGIQAGADLHPFRFFHRFPGGEENPAFFQRRTACRKGILNHQILAGLRIDKGCCHGAGDIGADGKILHAVLRKHPADGFIRPGRDFVDHGPGEGDTGGIPQPAGKSFRNQSALFPGFGDGENGLLQHVPVVGTVVHADHGQRMAAVPVTGR